ncbi:MAG: winged helix-turn-helix transcriptional regulator [Lachnospiraceae bacterium]|nr:winged helix-turn-helix transcriptional regulator [Lachnospiraceae bacterium]
MMDDIRSGKDGVSFVLVFKLDGNNELHNREMHVSGKFSRKQDIDPIKQDIDPINDPINTAGLSEREKKVLELLRQDPTLTRAKMAGILGCSDATVKRALGSMVQKNVIRRIGSNKKGEWVINS